MPEAAGAVAAAAVADRMHAPKEDRRLAIVLVLFFIMENLFRKFAMCIIPLLRNFRKGPSLHNLQKASTFSKKVKLKYHAFHLLFGVTVLS